MQLNGLVLMVLDSKLYNIHLASLLEPKLNHEKYTEPRDVDLLMNIWH